MKRAHTHQYFQSPTRSGGLYYTCGICGFTACRDVIDAAHPELVFHGPYPHVEGSAASWELRQKARLVSGRWIDRRVADGEWL